MSTDSMEKSPTPTRTQAVSISDLMMSLNTKGPGAATDGATVGECLLDTLCVKYSGMSAGLTIYEDSQVRSPVVRMQYKEVQEIDMVSYRSMHTTTKVDKKWLPEPARVIPGVALLLLVDMNFRDGHAEDPDKQKNNLLIISTPPGSSSLETVRLPPPVSL